VITEKVSIKVGTSIYNTYKDINVPLENPFKEFIDNSTQSYYDHKDELLKTKGFSNLIIRIYTKDDKLIILDNAYGMNKSDFDRALKLGAKREQYSENSRSQFGMGLKYAGMYLGDKVTIESTEMGSQEKYRATLDSNELKNNIEEIDRIIEFASEHEHYTKITIERLRHTYSQKTIDTLKDRLGKIYRYDVSKGVEIIFNDNNKVTYSEPILRINPQTGSEYIANISGSFDFGDRTYEYGGWVGILHVADVSNAGLSLIQYDRLIKMNYRPEKLFKKSNSFQYQRVIGEIILDKWPVVFNKTDFVWTNGLEERFIDELAKNKGIVEILKKSQELRFNEEKNKVDPKLLEKNTKELETMFNSFKSKEKTQMEMQTPPVEEFKAYVASLEVDTTLTLVYESIKYNFEFSFVNDESKEWFKIEPINEKEYKYRLIIDTSYKFYNKFFKKQVDKINFMQGLCALLAVAQISSRNSGFKDSYKFINKLNELIKLMG